MVLRALVFSGVALGSCQAVATTACTSNSTTDCAAPTEFHLSVASGAGFRSNPLFGGHNFPLWLMADVHYYDDAFFFDNGTLGYTLPFDAAVTVSLVSRINDEVSYFRRARATEFFEQALISDYGLLGPVERYQIKTELSIDDVAKRPWALDAGVQLDMFGQAWHTSLNWWHDVNGAYGGSHVKVAGQYQWQTSYGDFSIGSALHWKSRQLIDTYYGISAAEWNDEALQGKASLQPEVSMQWHKELTERWSVMSLIRYRWIDLKVEDESGATLQSPLQQDNHVRSIFLGLSYRFI